MRWRALLALLERLPQPGMSRAFGRLAALPLPGLLRGPLLGAFARATGIDASEAALPLSRYRTLDAFFIRELKPGTRTWPVRSDVLGSPVDGVLGQLGRIRDGELVQAKGRYYTAARLLDDAASARRYNGGHFITLYLGPRHYHRIHAPCSGTIPCARHVPGALLPVNAAAVLHVAELFPRNERLVCYIDGAAGRIAIVAIGAYNVGSISAAFDPAWGETGRVTNRRGAVARTRSYEPAQRIERGREIMAFHLGSTVVLLLERGRAVLEPSLSPGMDVRLGTSIARVESTSSRSVE